VKNDSLPITLFNPIQLTFLSCILRMMSNMTVACSNVGSWQAGSPVFGGPPGATAADPNIAWLRPDLCSNKNIPGFIANTIVHEAAHNCGALGDAGAYFDSTAADVADACSPWQP
jgi:hypothetical protein